MGIISEVMRQNFEDEQRKKRFEDELRMLAAQEAARKENAIALRDSNSLNSEFLRHKTEQEMQGKIAQYQPADVRSEFTGQPLSTVSRDNLSLVNAGNTMNDMEAAGYLAPGQKSVNAYQEELGASPLSGALGQASSEANLAGQGAAKARHRYSTVVDESNTPNAGLTAVALQDAARIAAQLKAAEDAAALPGAPDNVRALQNYTTGRAQSGFRLQPDVENTQRFENNATRAAAKRKIIDSLLADPVLEAQANDATDRNRITLSTLPPDWRIREQAALREAAMSPQEKLITHALQGKFSTAGSGFSPVSNGPGLGVQAPVGTPSAGLTQQQIIDQYNARKVGQQRR